MGFQQSLQIIELGHKTLSLALPPAPAYPVASLLVATLCPAGSDRPVGVWEFQLAPSHATGRLCLFPDSFGQGFLVLDQWDSMPLGHAHHVTLPPAGTRAFDLTLLRSGAFGTSSTHYRLQWARNREREKSLETWRRQSIPPVDWFYVELTSHCNLSCPFCPSRTLQRPRAFMSIDDAQTIFNKIGAYLSRRDATWGYTQTNRMVFLHVLGEPLMHPHFVECVGVAKDAGLIPALFTNATLLTDSNIRKIFAAGLSHITVSLNVMDQAGYSALGARDDIDEQHRRVIELLRERARRGAYRLHVDIQYIVSDGRTVAGHGLVGSRQQAWNCYRRWMLLLHRNIERSESHPVDRPPVVPLESMANPLPAEGADPSLRLPLDVGVDLVMKSGCSFGNAVLPPGMRLVTTRRGHCPFDSPWRQMAVFVDGSVSFCNLDYENTVNLGSLLEQSVDEIWDSPRMQGIRGDMAAGKLTEPLCQRCLGTLVPGAAAER